MVSLSPSLESTQQCPSLSLDTSEENKVWGRLCPINPSLRTLELSSDRVSFGRGTDCDIQFDDKLVSSLHCVIQRTEVAGVYVPFVYDHSTNGTRVKGRIIGKGKHTPLCDHDEITIVQEKGERPISYIYREASRMNLWSKYVELSKVLGTGSFGIVKLVVLQTDPTTLYALKEIDKKNFQESCGMNLSDEVELMKKLDHPNIIKLIEAFENAFSFIIVLEYADGGSLSDLINTKPISEPISKLIFKQLLSAVDYLHSLKMVHRDIKPQNVLMKKDENGRPLIVKLADFGLSRSVGDGSCMNTRCGTPEFVAPEIYSREGYTAKVDIWSLGCVLFNMLSQGYPFDSRKYADADVRREKGIIEFNQNEWKDISDEAKSFIKVLLTRDPNQRPSSTEMFKFSWLNESNKRKREKVSEVHLPSTRQTKRKKLLDKHESSRHSAKPQKVCSVERNESSSLSTTLPRRQKEESNAESAPKEAQQKTSDDESEVESNGKQELPYCLLGQKCQRKDNPIHARRYRH